MYFQRSNQPTGGAAWKPRCCSNPVFSIVTGAGGTGFGGGVTGGGVTGGGVAGAGVTGRGVAGAGVAGRGRGVSGSGFGLGLGVVSGSGLGLGFGVASGSARGLGFGVVSGSGVVGREGLGLGFGAGSGGGVIGTVRISSRALRNCRFLSSSLVCPRRAAACKIHRASKDRRKGRTRQMLGSRASSFKRGAREDAGAA